MLLVLSRSHRQLTTRLAAHYEIPFEEFPLVVFKELLLDSMYIMQSKHQPILLIQRPGNEEEAKFDQVLLHHLQLNLRLSLIHIQRLFEQTQELVQAELVHVVDFDKVFEQHELLRP